MRQSAFAASARRRPTSIAVGTALDQTFANATGDFATVLGADRRAQHDAGPDRAGYDQRPALCRLRHHEHQQQRAVHERAGPADGQRARRGERRPAPGAGGGLRDRGLRWRRPVERVGQRAGWPRQRAGRRQRLDPHLQFRRHRGRHRLPLRSALPGRHRRRLHPRHPVGEQLPGPGLVRQRQRRRLRQLHPRRLLRRCAGGLRLLQQPAAAPDPDPRPAAADRHRLRPAPTSSSARSRPATRSASMRRPPRPSRRSAASRSRA